MKKFISMAIMAAMILTMAGCSDNKENSSIPSESSSTSDVSKPESKPVEPESKPEESNPESKPAEPEKTVSPADIEAAIAKALGDGYFCTVDVPESELFLSNMAGIDLSQLESYTAKISPVPAVDLDTVLVMKCKSGYAETAVDILNENYAQTISYIRQYPFGVAKVEGARLYKIGDIVMFILAGNIADSDATAEDEAKLAASEYEIIDNVIKSLFGTLPKNLAVIKEPELPDNGGEFDGGFDDFEDMPIIGG